MKQTLFTCILLLSLLQLGFGQISYTGCSGPLPGTYPYTLNAATPVNDGGTIRNTYQNTPANCQLSAQCVFRVQWDISNSRWEIRASSDGGASFPHLLYINTTASFPDPPDLTLGTWVAQGPCGGQAITTWTGNVQSTVSSAAPEIDVMGNGVSIVDGDVSPTAGDDTDFGTIALGNNDVHTFTIDNSGTGTLNVTSIVMSGTNAADFAVGGITLPATVAAGASTTFTLTFTPAAAGVRTATVTINNDDADEGTYDYVVQGTGMANPEIDVLGNAVSITDGDATPSTTDDTEFGSVALGNNDVHTFTIDNSAGTGTLTVTSMSVTGAGSGDFVVGGISFPANITAGGSTTFTLTFTPSTAGPRIATVNINSNDADEGSYNYAVQGAGAERIAITEWISDPMGSDATDEWVELYNYGASPIDLQNWRIKDEGTDNSLISSASFIVPAGGYVILAKNKAAFEAQWLNGCVHANILEVAGLNLSNSADEIIIENGMGSTVWSVAYANDETAGRATHYTEAPTFTNLIWGSGASPGINRAGNDVTTTLGYEKNNVTADPAVMTSITGDMGSPFNGTLVTKDIVRGDVLDFDGGNDQINLPTGVAVSQLNEFTVEAWVKWDGTGNGCIYAEGNTGSNNPMFSIIPRSVNSGRMELVLRDNSQVGLVAQPTTGGIVVNEWTHIAVRRTTATNLQVFINGVQTDDLTFSAPSAWTVNNVKIGIRQRASTDSPFSGEIDEVRIWSVARTANQIRENMHLTLGSCPTGLEAYYQMNDGTGSGTVADKTGNGNDGTLTNMDPATDWMPSGVNIGNDAGGVSKSQTITGIPAGSGTQNFASANASMFFLEHSGTEDFTITYQAFAPNTIAGATGVNVIANPMWTVNKSTATETFLANYTFTYPTPTFTNLNPTKYSLYHRPMNSEGNWTKVATAHAITATTATFTKMTLTGQFIIVQESENLVSDVRGHMYNISDNSERIFCSGVNLSNSSFTIELWAKRNSTTTEDHFFGQGTAGTRAGLHARYNTNGSISFAFFNDDLITAPSQPAAIDGEWHHLAFVYNVGTQRREIFIDGVLLASDNAGGNFSGAAGMNIGAHIPAGVGATNSFDGTLDEVRIWNTVRTEAAIRENMHLTLKGNETGLVSYYQFNNDDPVGTANGVKDAVGSNDGTTQNMVVADYMPSEVAVAAGASDRVTIGAAGVYTFPNTGVQITFGTNTPNGEIVVSRLETEKPHGWGSIGADVDNEYFVVKNYGTATFDPLVDLTFNRLSYVSSVDVGVPQGSSPLQLYKRADNAFGSTWGSSFGGADNATAGSNAMISYNATNNVTSFSQIVLANSGPNSDLPVELMRFDAQRLNADKVQLNWSTATEINNKGFYVERMLDTEDEFEAVAYLEGQGNTVLVTNYQVIDDNSYTGIAYYRLRQVDFDGTVTYSEIKAVEGVAITSKNHYIDVSIYPNPIYKDLNVRFNKLPKGVKTAQVEIRNLNGQLMQSFSAAVQSYKVLDIEVSNLTPAMYVLSIELDNKQSIIQKFVKQ